MSKVLLGFLVLAGIMGFWGVSSYNKLVSLDQAVQAQWSQVENVYQRRADLVPNLVETVKSYAAHERGVFEEVTQARTAVQRAATPGDAAAAGGRLDAALGRLFAVAEAYPELRASENFSELQDELTDTEDKIAAARRYYNSVVQQFNTSQQTFPASLVAGTFGFSPREFFRLEDDGDRAPVAVKL
jgi:LemA protein